MTDGTAPAPERWDDRPIDSADRDLLGFDTFAAHLADHVLSSGHDQSFVTALTGPWGSGKTSIANLMTTHIAGESKTQVVWFRPWLFSTHLDLAASFLNEIAHYTGADQATGKELAGAITDYALALTDASATVSGAPIRLSKIRSAYATILRKRTLAHETAALSAYQARVRKALKDSGLRFIVIVDDLDRLTPREILSVFQVVKAVADLPGISYLLLFDETAVDAALASEHLDPRPYLEKIIQANLRVPSPNQTRLDEVFSAALNRVVSDVHEEAWDQARWEQLYRTSLQPLFRHIRDIQRFANSLAFHFQLIRDEVDAIDFIALEAIRLFAPQAHAELGRSNQWFTSAPLEHMKQDYEDAHQRVLDAVPLAVRGPLNEALDLTFPALHPMLVHGSDNWKQKRASVASHFDRYFEYALSPDAVPEDALRALLALSRDRAIEELTLYRDRGRISYALARLEPIVQSNPVDASNLVLACLEIAGDLDPDQLGLAGGTDMLRTVRVVWASLAEDSSERKLQLLELIDSTERIEGIARTIAWERELLRREKKGRREAPHVDEGDLSAIEAAASERMQAAAANGSLEQSAWFFTILYDWERWTSSETVRQYVSEITGDDDGLVAYLKRGMRKYWSSSERGTEERVRLSYEAVAHFLDVPNAEARVADLVEEDRFAEDERSAMRRFLAKKEEEEDGPW